MGYVTALLVFLVPCDPEEGTFYSIFESFYQSFYSEMFYYFGSVFLDHTTSLYVSLLLVLATALCVHSFLDLKSAWGLSHKSLDDIQDPIVDDLKRTKTYAFYMFKLTTIGGLTLAIGERFNQV